MSYSEKDLVRIAKRENNKLRNYLVVDPLQAKHIPVSPDEALRLFTALAGTVKDRYAEERLLLIGFAETATAIGAQVAVTLGAKYIQTTREAIPDVEYLFFSEEHSHATEQKLVKDDLDAAFPETDRVIFIEDEVTTGKTILNIVDILEKRYVGENGRKPAFSVASLLNGMQEEHLKRYADRGIELFYLVKTDHGGYGEIAERYAGDGDYYDYSQQGVGDKRQPVPEGGKGDYADYSQQGVGDKRQPVPEGGKRDYIDYSQQEIGDAGQGGAGTELTVPGAVNARRLVDGAQYETCCDMLWKRISEYLGTITGERILVVGTEEFMFPALYVGRGLERAGNDVKCHSTTRSPIAVSRESAYPLHARYELNSLYDPRRRTFLYDIGSYDRVLVITDAPGQMPTQEGMAEPDGAYSLLAALKKYNSNILLIRWCQA